MRPLLFIPSPRDVPEVKEAISKLKIDKLWVKYYTAEEAYKTARDWFLSRDYTHLLINPDDLIVTPENLDNLLMSATDRVISGWCINTILDNWKELDQTNISYTMCYDPPSGSTYDSYNFIPVKHINTLLSDGKSIIKVKFAGFALTSIPRKIVEEIPFRTSEGCCIDSTFALDLYQKEIDQFVHLRVRTLHMKIPFDEIKTGRLEKQIIFEEDKS